VLGPLLGRRPALVAIANRTVARARDLATEFRAHGTLAASGFDVEAPTPFDLVINGTSASLEGSMPPVTPAVIGPQTVCYDMAYAKGETPFTRFAHERGARAAFKGWGMLVEQAAEAFLIWRGIRPQTRPVLDLLTSSVTRES
jgi:shikimate dehydrogenase